VYTVNALVANAGREFLPGSAATLRIPDGERPAVLVPAPALVRQGELIGVRIETASGFELRWVQAGAVANDMVEVYAGLRGGDRILVGGE
jgi:hypothetical protein